MMFNIFTKSYTITTIYLQNIFITPKRNFVTITSHSLFSSSPQPLATTNLLSVSIDLPILDFCINGIIQYVAFCVWLL